jgi:hypothetical protein
MKFGSVRFRSVTFGRGVVLLILGVAIGTGLFLHNWLNDTNLRDHVLAALRHRIRAPFELSPEQIGIDLEHGLIIHNLVVPYPKSSGAPGVAIAAERIEITIDTKGNSQVETKGFSGSECLEASKFVEQALGKQTGTRTTAEFFSSSVNQNAIQNSNGS